MQGYDEPSIDGQWNLQFRCSTWYSPDEILDRLNTWGNVYGTGWEFLDTNDLWDIIKKGARSMVEL